MIFTLLRGKKSSVHEKREVTIPGCNTVTVPLKREQNPENGVVGVQEIKI